MNNTLNIRELVEGQRGNRGEILSRLGRLFQEVRVLEPQLNAFLTVTEEEGSAIAQSLQEQDPQKEPMPLEGVPFSVKDQIITQGVETTCGSEILRGFVPPFQSTVVQRLLGAGAVLVGKTNQDEFGMGSASETSFQGTVKNPWNPDRVAGGSSGGSAVSVASGMVSFSIGTDTGGSIRQPASFTGTVGLKPTYGRVSRYGAIAYASSMDQMGPMTRNVEDAARVLQVIAGHDPMDATSSTKPVPDYVSAVSKGVKGLKFGLPKEYMDCSMDAGVRTAVEAGIQRIKDAGGEVVPVDLPHTEFAIPTYYILASAEASSNLARYDGVRYGHRSSGDGSLEDMYQDTRTEGFGAEVQRRIMLGTFCLSSGYVDAFYVKAQQVRTLIIEDFKRVFDQVDVLVSPTVPVVAWEHGAMADDPLAMYQMDVLTTACNLAGLPGISVPCGFSEGLPVGLQLMAAPFQEELLFAAAGAHEGRYEERSRRPDLHTREWMSED